MRYTIFEKSPGIYEATTLDSEVNRYATGDTPEKALAWLMVAIRLRRQVIALERGEVSGQQLLDNPTYGGVNKEEMQLIA